MAKQSSELAIEELKKLLREEEELKGVVANKIEELITELQGNHLHTFDPAVQRIIDGFTYFKLNNFDKYPELYNELALQQSPKYMVFAYSDSRGSPDIILNFQPGEAFLVCNIANVVPPFNQVLNILVIGHSRYAGVQRLMSHPEDGSAPYDFIDDWMKIGLPAKVKVLKEYEGYDFEEQCRFCEKESVNNWLMNLQTFPYVERGVRNESLEILGGYYDFVNGKFDLWKYKSQITK